MVGQMKLLVVGTVLLWVSAPVHLDAAPKTRDGFMLRVVNGVGFGHRSEDLGARNGVVEYIGIHSVTEFAIGGRLSQGFSLHATGFSSGADQVGLKSRARTEKMGASDITIDSAAFGLGGTLFFLEERFFITTSIGLASANVSESSTADNVRVVRQVTDGLGLGLSSGLGYEWWVHPEWAIGIAGLFQAYWLAPSPEEPCEGDKDCSRTIQHIAGGIAFSITFH